MCQCAGECGAGGSNAPGLAFRALLVCAWLLIVIQTNGHSSNCLAAIAVACLVDMLTLGSSSSSSSGGGGSGGSSGGSRRRLHSCSPTTPKLCAVDESLCTVIRKF